MKNTTTHHRTTRTVHPAVDAVGARHAETVQLITRDTQGAVTRELWERMDGPMAGAGYRLVIARGVGIVSIAECCL